MSIDFAWWFHNMGPEIEMETLERMERMIAEKQNVKTMLRAQHTAYSHPHMHPYKYPTI